LESNNGILIDKKIIDGLDYNFPRALGYQIGTRYMNNHLFDMTAVLFSINLTWCI